MLSALAAAVSGPQVPLKESIRAQLEKEIPKDDVINFELDLISFAHSDVTHETTFEDFWADCDRRCKDQELAAALDRVDFPRAYLALITAILSICTLVALLAAILTPMSHFILNVGIPFAAICACVFYCTEVEQRSRQYKEALRRRIILDRIRPPAKGK